VVETGINDVTSGISEILDMNENALRLLQEQVSLISQTQQVMMEKLGVTGNTSGNAGPVTPAPQSPRLTSTPNVMPASA
jgi:hypothetical protein